MYEFDNYQKEALTTLVCPDGELRSYLPLQLAAEAGEVAAKFAKPLRDGRTLDDMAIIRELGDVLWYVAVTAEYLGYDLSEVAKINLEKLADRAGRNQLAGDGDYR